MKIFGIQIGKAEIEDVQNVSKNIPTGQNIKQKVVVERELTRSAQNVNKWRTATITAESVINPNRTELYKIYKDVVLDAHLSALMNTIKLKVTSGDFDLCNADGTENEEASDLLNSEWFTFYLEMFIESLFYGHSLIQLGGVKNDKFIDFELIPREHVRPEFQMVVPDQWTYANNGVKYNEPPYSDWIIEIGNRHDLGLLHKATPLVLWKKGVLGAWSHFSELFGTPLRVGKTNILDPNSRKNMDAMLKNMGGSNYAVLNTDDVIELVERSNSDSFQVFNAFIDRLNSEMSKLILGQTGTTDEKSFVGSAQVHNDILATYITAIKSKIENHVTAVILPKMASFGMIPQGLKFRWDNEESVSLLNKFDFTKELLKYYKIPAEWINETFSIPVEDGTITTSLNPDGTPTTSVIPEIENLLKM
jgi:hypothetical protein